MENFSYHVPFYIVRGGIATSGFSSDLTGSKVGLYDRANFAVATNSGNGKEFFFAQGNIGGRDWYGQPITESHKSPFFYGKDVEDIYLSLPQTILNEEWVLGFNGSPSSKSLQFEKGKPVRVKLLFTGNPSYRFFNGPKEYVVSYTPAEDCTTPCTDNCPEVVEDCLTHTQKLVDAINQHTELKKFGVTAKIVRADYAAATTNMTKRCLTLCDNGSPIDLQAVQAQVSSQYVVTRTGRVGSLSTYEFCQPNGDAAPSAFQRTNSVLQAVCDTCPSGSFLIGAKEVYLVNRPIVGGEDFTTVLSKDNYANAIWTAYASQESITTSTSTSTSTTVAGSYNSDATFIGYTSSHAIVKIKFAAGSIIDPAIGADTLTKITTEPAVCVFDIPASVAWTSCGTGIRSQRSLRINGINRPDCLPNGDRLTDLTSILSGVQGIQIGTLAKVAGVGCVDDYTVDQYSVDCLPEDCLTSNVTFTYDSLPAFENSSWEVVPPTVTADPTRRCGIRITAGYIDPKFGDCSFDVKDYYETQPVKFEVSLLQEDGSRCDYSQLPTQLQTQVGRIARQSGEYVVRQAIMKTEAYIKHVKQWSADSREREAFDMNILNLVDRNAYYKLYYVTFKASYGYSYRKNEQEKFTAVFAFKENDSAAQLFETQILDVLTVKSGKVLHIEK